MTKSDYDKIMQRVWENGLIESEDDEIQLVEQRNAFDFAASERGFSKDEIEEAHEKWD